MGQAKRRGTFEQRVAQAVAKQTLKEALIRKRIQALLPEKAKNEKFLERLTNKVSRKLGAGIYFPEISDSLADQEDEASKVEGLHPTAL